MPLNIEWRTEFSRDAFGNQRRVGVGLHGAEGNQEFISTEASHSIFFTRKRAQPLSDLLQQHVSNRMAQRIIDDFEAVDVEIDQSNLFAAAFGDGDCLSESVFQEGEVRQICERIEIGEKLNPILSQFSLGNINQRPLEDLLSVIT